MKNTNKLWPSILLTVLMAALLAVMVAVGLTAAAESQIQYSKAAKASPSLCQHRICQRTASHISTAAATAAFRDSLSACMGMMTV